METDRRTPQDAERALGSEERGRERAEDAADRSTAGAEHPSQTAGAEHPSQTAGTEHPPQKSDGAERPLQKSRWRITVLLVMLLCVAAAGVVVLLRSRARQDPPEPPVSDADTFDPQAAYAPVLNTLAEARSRIDQGKTTREVGMEMRSPILGLTDNYIGYYAYGTLYYSFYDLNGDGTEELIIGTVNGTEEIIIVDIFIMRDGSPERMLGKYTVELDGNRWTIYPSSYKISQNGDVWLYMYIYPDDAGTIRLTLSDAARPVVREVFIPYMAHMGLYDQRWNYIVFPCPDEATTYDRFLDECLARMENGEGDPLEIYADSSAVSTNRFFVPDADYVPADLTWNLFLEAGSE